MISMASLERAHWSVRDWYHAVVMKDAETICQNRLATDPDQHPLLHLRGLLALRNNQRDLALTCLTRAMALDPGNAAYCAHLGDVLLGQACPIQAESLYRRALALAPEAPELHCRLGRALFQQGQLVEATAAYRTALGINPAWARSYSELGDVLQARGERQKAIKCYENALRLDPENVNGYERLGRARMRHAHWRLALRVFRKGLQRDWNRTELHLGVGEALLKLGLRDEAVDEFRAAVAIEPHNVTACEQLARTLDRLGARDEAMGAWLSLGSALERRDKYGRAASAYHEALKRKPDCLGALFGLGRAYIELAEPRKAVAPLEAAIGLAPEYEPGHHRLGMAYGSLGNIQRGWNEIALCTRCGLLRRRSFEQPLWDGTKPTGRTILLWMDAGLGDAIQLIRYAQLVTEAGGRVVVECHRNLVSLFEHATGVDRVVALGMPLPSFDAHMPMTLLPEAFQTGLATIPDGMPYLKVQPDLRETWRRWRPAQEKTVGLVWAGDFAHNDSRLKSAPLAAFAPLAYFSGIRFVSLQLGPQSVEALMPPSGLQVDRRLSESCTVADTAALILNLDLVITVDTMVAHLAGALARPVWTLLRHAADWRWQSTGETSPWYPTMRLFRQTSAGDWAGVMDRVRSALKDWFL